MLGAVEHYEWLGTAFGGAGAGASRRARIAAGLKAVEAHEHALTVRLIDGLKAIPGLAIQGLTERQALARRVPTVSFTKEGADPAAIVQAMADKDIYLWSGHNYGVEPVRRLGLIDRGGVVRIGLAQYSTAEEVDRLLAALRG